MIKRIFDIVFSSFILLFFSPLYLILACLIGFNLGSPILFKQVRTGCNGKPFTIYKFRTMIELRNDQGIILSDEDRLTKFGKFLRSTSMDELPEFWNVLRGEMSIVGPRPLLTEYLPRYSEEELRRHNVRPGITGWAQINGRNAIDWKKKFEYDIWYVENKNLLLDLKILFLTIIVVFQRRNINSSNKETQSKFRGN